MRVKGVRVTWENLPGVDLYVDTEPSNPVQFLNVSMQSGSEHSSGQSEDGNRICKRASHYLAPRPKPAHLGEAQVLLEPNIWLILEE